MALATREEVMQALFDLTLPLEGAGTLKTRSRAIRPVEDVDREHQPALFQVEIGENQDQLSGTPPRRRFEVWWVIYTNRGDNDGINPSTQINEILDALDSVLKPDPGKDRQDLGGKVTYARQSGRTEISEGTLGDQLVAVYPIEILFPYEGEGINVWDSGSLFLIPEGPNPTPVKIGALQSVDLQFDVELKGIRTQLKFPVKYTAGLNGAKATAAQAKIDGAAFALALYGKSVSSGSRKVQLQESHPFPGPMTIMVPSGTFAFDLGVVKKQDGMVFKRVAAAPGLGEYTVAANVYTFNAGETGDALISYAYDATTGKKLALNNEFMHVAPTFAVLLASTFNGKQATFWLPACTSSQLLIPMKLEQYALPQFSFEAQQDINTGEVGTFSFAE